MADLIDDESVWPRMISLRDCLCKEIADSGLPDVCFCEVLPGEAAPFYYVDGGQAWVRLANAYPSTVFPVQNQEPRGSCASPLANLIEVGIVRCPIVPRSQAQVLPTEAEQFEATRIQMADMAAMRRAIRCCFGSKDALLGTYTPIGDEEGAIGGTWQVYI